MIALKRYPKIIYPHRHARNGFIPEAPFIRRTVKAQNHIMAYRRKSWLNASDFTGRFTGSAGTDLYRCYGHAGYGATHLGIIVALGLDSSGTGADPYVRIARTASTLGTTNLDIHGGNYDNAAGAPTDAPSEIIWREGRIPLTANEAFSVVVTAADYARVMSICLYEIASNVITNSTSYYLEAEPVVEFPVYDTYRQKQLQGLSQIWRRNGGHLLTYPGAGTGTASTSASTTWTNVIDAATSVSATTAGYYLGDGDADLNMMRRATDTTVDVVLAAYCSVTNSATGEVRLQDGSGTICSITGMGTAAAWYTTTTTIATSSLEKADLQFRTSNAANTISLHAVCLYAYLA